MSSEGPITATSSTCECTAWMSMKLPCRHILTTRSKLGLGLYDESLCSEQWTTAYYKQSQQIFFSQDLPYDSPGGITQLSLPKKGPYPRYMSNHCTHIQQSLVLAVLFWFRQISLSVLLDLPPNLLHLCLSQPRENSLLALKYWKR